MTKPKISILCLTYNQENYIRQALDSFLMQKTNFEYEVLINDDASTDGTQDILYEYQKKYPKIIKPFFQPINRYSTGERNFILRYLMPRVKGEYLAVCEGDDYWTDENKLQKQADFLDSHPKYALCFHPVRVVFENHEEQEFIFPNRKTNFDLRDLLDENFIQTNSVMYRKQEYKHVNTNVMPADWYLHLYHARFGKIGFINEVMSVYRRHAGGIWWDSYNNRDAFIEKYGILHINMYFELLKFYSNSNSNKSIILANLEYMVRAIMDLKSEKRKHILTSTIIDEPKLTYAAILNVYTTRKNEFEKLLDELEKKNKKKTNELNALKVAHNDIYNELQAMKNSNSWKLTYPLRRITDFIKRG